MGGWRRTDRNAVSLQFKCYILVFFSFFSSSPSLTVDGIHAPSLSAAITARAVIRVTGDRGRSASGHQKGFRGAGSTSLITPLNVLKSQISPRSCISLIAIECSINFMSYNYV